MVRRITIPCSFKNSKIIPVNFYIGNPVANTNPIYFQNEWLASRGGAVKKEVMEALDKLQTLAEKNRVPFEDLYDYVVKEITEFEEIKSERINSAKKIINFSNNHKELTNNE